MIRSTGLSVCADPGQLRAETSARADVDNSTATGSLHASRICTAQREGGYVVDQHIDRAACCLLDLRDPCRRYSAVGQVQHLCVESSLSGFGKFRGV